MPRALGARRLPLPLRGRSCQHVRMSQDTAPDATTSPTPDALASHVTPEREAPPNPAPATVDRSGLIAASECVPEAFWKAAAQFHRLR